VNDWTSGFQLIRDLLIEAMLLDRGGMAWVNRVGGKPVEIVHYRTGTITYQEEETRELLYRLSGRPIPASDVIHIRAPFGKAPVTLARRAILAAAAMETHAQKLWSNGARPGGVLEVPQNIGEEAVKKIKAGWAAAHEGGTNSGRTAILWGGTKYSQTALNSTDAQYIENRRYQMEEIARAFNMSPVMLGDLTKSSYANAWQKNREFLGITLAPWLRIVEAAFNRALLTNEERSRLTFKFDVDDLSRVDLEKRASAISSLITSRVINPNEGRAWLDSGLAPYKGGNEFANPNTGASQPNAKKEDADGM
jgi:HK97 family phage portal protein